MSTMSCWNCGYALGPRDNYCPNCGVESLGTGKRETRILCSDCNASIALSDAEAGDGALLCAECARKRRAVREQGTERKQREKAVLVSTGMRSRRKADRFEVPRAFVRIAPVGVTATLLREKKLRIGALVDLSRTGLQCVASGRFAPGDIIRVEVLIPAFTQPLGLRAIVRWVRPERDPRCRIGIEFDPKDPTTQAHLEALEKHEALRNAAHLLEEKRASGPRRGPSGATPGADADF